MSNDTKDNPVEDASEDENIEEALNDAALKASSMFSSSEASSTGLSFVSFHYSHLVSPSRNLNS